MEDLAHHILDIVENSLTAGARHVEILIGESSREDLTELRIKDDGAGMPEDLLKQATDPFVTTKREKRYGLGLSLLEQAAVAAGGSLGIESEANKGCELHATFTRSHIDMKPFGDMRSTLLVLIASYPDVDFTYRHDNDGSEFLFDTREIKEQLEGIPINHPAALKTIREVLQSEAA